MSPSPLDFKTIDIVDTRPPSWLGVPLARACRSCGCTEDRACFDIENGPCWWAEPDLCSACHRIREKLRARYRGRWEGIAFAVALWALIFLAWGVLEL